MSSIADGNLLFTDLYQQTAQELIDCTAPELPKAALNEVEKLKRLNDAVHKICDLRTRSFQETAKAGSFDLLVSPYAADFYVAVKT